MTFENWQEYVPLFIIIVCSVGLVVLSGYINSNINNPKKVKLYTNISRWTGVVCVVTTAYLLCQLQKRLNASNAFGFG